MERVTPRLGNALVVDDKVQVAVPDVLEHKANVLVDTTP